MPKLKTDNIDARSGTIYPGALADIVNGRSKKALGNAGGLTQFGVNITTLPPGSASAHRHWHAAEDEFVYIISGKGLLVEDDGETPMAPGDAACFPAGIANGHHLINRSEENLVILEIGSRLADETVTYTDPDVDMQVRKENGTWRVTHKDGSAF